MDAGALLVIGILSMAVILALAAAIAPRLKKYKFQSPIKKILPKKRARSKPKQKKKRLWIRIG